VISPVAVNALLTVVVPDESPKESVVAAPLTLKMVAVVLKRLAVVGYVVLNHH